MILNNLNEMEVCEIFGPTLQEIREDIFNSGWCVFLSFVSSSTERYFSGLLNASVHGEYERPPAPFVPLNGRK